jgi:effector-binding domain-containing protein
MIDNEQIKEEAKAYHKGKKEGAKQAWKRMLKAIKQWNKEIQQTETSMEFEVFVKERLKELKK